MSSSIPKSKSSSKLKKTDFNIYLAVVLSTIDDDPADYQVILHSRDNISCHVFTTIPALDRNGKPDRSGAMLHSEDVLLQGSNYVPGHCEGIHKESIGYLAEEELPSFSRLFKRHKARESQFTVFRFLWDLVDHKLVHEDDVKEVCPEFDNGAFGKWWFDQGK